MARKRYKKKRADYRKGGRVKYAHGGRPSRRDYQSNDEYRIALEQWQNTRNLGSTAAEMPVRTSSPAKRFPTPTPTPTPAPAPFKSSDYDKDRDLHATKGYIAPKLGRVTAPSTVGTITPAAPAPSRPQTNLIIPSTQTQLGLDPSDSALLGINQQISKNIENKGFVQGAKDAVLEHGVDFAIDLVTNPAGTIIKGAIEKGPSVIGSLISGIGNIFRGLVPNKDLEKYQQAIADQATAAGLKPEEVLAAAKEARIEIEASEAASESTSSDSGKTEYQGWGGASEGKVEGQVSIPEALGAFSISPAAYLYGGVGSSFESSRDAYTESGQYDIDKAAQDAAFDQMRAARGESVPRTKEETQQLIAEHRARIGAELAGGTMTPAATATFSPAAQQARQLRQGGQNLGEGEYTLPGYPSTPVFAPVEKGPIDRSNTKQAVSEILEAGRIPDPIKTDPNIKDTVTTIAPGTKAVAGQAGPVNVDQAVTGTSIAGQQQAPITTATVDPTLVGEGAQVDAAVGTVRDEALAEAAQVEDTPVIEGADVEIKEGDLTARIIGTVSSEAIATAAQAAGTTLSKVTRAKKQLRNSGMSEEAITALGNDPEDLEDRLMDLTEQERGVIGDLPEEALVSNQLNSLLKGMENGEIPAWARPAVSSVEQILAERGMEASTVGRDALFNAIIQSAIPLAQSNAQAIQQSVAQTRDIEAREELANVQMRQQTALQNASNVFQMDMTQFSVDQQTALSNSKFLQTVSLTEASNDQQAAIQNALIDTQINMQDATLLQQVRMQNAKTFLSMDMSNLENEQQSKVLNAQLQNQILLSDQAALNAAQQFNATSENQTNQFMASLAQQIELSNVDRADRMTITNNAAINARAATQAVIDADLAKANAALTTDINKANTEYEFKRDSFNATNSAAIKASNVAWRRNANTINTAAANTIAMQNAMNAFSLSSAELAYLWQEARDTASFSFQTRERELDRQNALKMQVLVNDANSALNAANNQSNNRRAFYDHVLTELWKAPEV